MLRVQAKQRQPCLSHEQAGQIELAAAFVPLDKSFNSNNNSALVTVTKIHPGSTHKR